MFIQEFLFLVTICNRVRRLDTQVCHKQMYWLLRLLGLYDMSRVGTNVCLYVPVTLYGCMNRCFQYTPFLLKDECLFQVNLVLGRIPYIITPLVKNPDGAARSMELLIMDILSRASPIKNQYPTRTGRIITYVLHSTVINYMTGPG